VSTGLVPSTRRYQGAAGGEVGGGLAMRCIPADDQAHAKQPERHGALHGPAAANLASFSDPGDLPGFPEQHLHDPPARVPFDQLSGCGSEIGCDHGQRTNMATKVEDLPTAAVGSNGPSRPAWTQRDPDAAPPSTLWGCVRPPRRCQHARDPDRGLDDTECRKLLAERHLGRLAIPDFGGPVIFPVNYVFDRDLIVFRTDPGSKLDAATER
jgi:pyridoxamine 5'-phosphate oxidase-like protein